MAIIKITKTAVTETVSSETTATETVTTTTKETTTTQTIMGSPTTTETTTTDTTITTASNGNGRGGEEDGSNVVAARDTVRTVRVRQTRRYVESNEAFMTLQHANFSAVDKGLPSSTC